MHGEYEYHDDDDERTWHGGVEHVTVSGWSHWRSKVSTYNMRLLVACKSIDDYIYCTPLLITPEECPAADPQCNETLRAWTSDGLHNLLTASRDLLIASPSSRPRPLCRLNHPRRRPVLPHHTTTSLR